MGYKKNNRVLNILLVVAIFSAQIMPSVALADPMIPTSNTTVQPAPGVSAANLQSAENAAQANIDQLNQNLMASTSTDFSVSYSLQTPYNGPYSRVALSKSGDELTIIATKESINESKTFIINPLLKTAAYKIQNTSVNQQVSVSAASDSNLYAAILQDARFALEKALANAQIQNPENADIKQHMDEAHLTLDQALKANQHIVNLPDGFVLYVNHISIEKRQNIVTVKIAYLATHLPSGHGTQTDVVDLSTPGHGMVKRTLATGVTSSSKEDVDASLFNVYLFNNLNVASYARQATSNIDVRKAANEVLTLLGQYSIRNRSVTPITVDAPSTKQNEKLISVVGPSEFTPGQTSTYTYQYNPSGDLVSVSEIYDLDVSGQKYRTSGTIHYQNGRRISADYVSVTPGFRSGPVTTSYHIEYLFDSTGKETGYTRTGGFGTTQGVNIYSTDGKLIRVEETTIYPLSSYQTSYRLIEYTYSGDVLSRKAIYVSTGSPAMPEANDPPSLIEHFTTGQTANGIPIADRVQTFDSFGLWREMNFAYRNVVALPVDSNGNHIFPGETFNKTNGTIDVYVRSRSVQPLFGYPYLVNDIIVIRDRATGKEIGTVPFGGYSGTTIRSVQFAPDGKNIVVQHAAVEGVGLTVIRTSDAARVVNFANRFDIREISSVGAISNGSVVLTYTTGKVDGTTASVTHTFLFGDINGKLMGISPDGQVKAVLTKRLMPKVSGGSQDTVNEYLTLINSTTNAVIRETLVNTVLVDYGTRAPKADRTSSVSFSPNSQRVGVLSSFPTYGRETPSIGSINNYVVFNMTNGAKIFDLRARLGYDLKITNLNISLTNTSVKLVYRRVIANPSTYASTLGSQITRTFTV